MTSRQTRSIRSKASRRSKTSASGKSDHHKPQSTTSRKPNANGCGCKGCFSGNACLVYPPTNHRFCNDDDNYDCNCNCDDEPCDFDFLDACNIKDEFDYDCNWLLQETNKPVIRPCYRCMTLPGRPTTYWEKEIVKFDPCATWDPNVVEKGQTGRPRYRRERCSDNYNGSGKGKGKHGNSSMTSSKRSYHRKAYEFEGEGEDAGDGYGYGMGLKDDCDNATNCTDYDDSQDGCCDDDNNKVETDNVGVGNKDIVIGEACTAYKCYLDPCLPPGFAYCTPKRPWKPFCGPPCPQSWPERPDCPDNYNGSGNDSGSGNISPKKENSCFSAEQNLDFMNSCNPYCPCRGICPDDGRNCQKTTLPPEWIMPIPLCDIKVQTAAGNAHSTERHIRCVPRPKDPCVNKKRCCKRKNIQASQEDDEFAGEGEEPSGESGEYETF